MIDLALMNKLIFAVAENARLILIGDRHQLASVEAGSVFGDICLGGKSNALADTLTLLTRSYRFNAGQGIEKLAESINAGKSDTVIEILSNAEFPEVEWLDPESDSSTWQQQLKTNIFQQLGAIKSAESSTEKFAKLSHFQLLCAHQKGRFGVAGITSAIDDWVKKKDRLADKSWYDGKPIIITENDYQTKLFNADNGVVVAEKDQKFRVEFQSSSEHSQSLSISRLPAHDNAWAISVHKSQGSEFDEVMLVLPETPSPVITRELLYTAITRAKSKITIVSNEKVLRHAITHQVQRRSGLANSLKPDQSGEISTPKDEPQLTLF
jgi:exodeoxyribonuclease V alpha subunit